MAEVYILYSEKLNKHYVGSCKDFHMRYEEHLSKKFQDGYTSKANDWIVLLRITDLEYAQSRKVEAHIKAMKSRVYIENLLQYPEMQDKLRAKFADSGSSR
jgi:putative endonuclease